MAPNSSREHWHISKTIPIALIFAVFCNAGIFIWYASKLDSKVSVLEDNILVLSDRVKDDRAFQIEQRVRVWERVNQIEAQLRATETRLARLDTTMEHIKEQVDRLVSFFIEERAKGKMKDE